MGYYITTGGLLALAGLHVLSLLAIAAVTWWATRCTGPHNHATAEDRSRFRPARCIYTTGSYPVVHRTTAPTKVLAGVRRGVRR